MALRDLFVKFQIDLTGAEKVDQADKAMAKAKESALDLGGALKGLAAVWAARTILNGVRNFIQGTIDQADALDHQAEMLGMTTDQLQKYQYAASLVGVTAQQAAVGFRFFNRVIGEAEFGTKGALKTLSRLGIQINDAGGKVRPTNDLLMDFADHLAKIPDQQRRTALAMSTLGRSGAALLPFLQKGSKALKEMFADVEELGGGFNKEFVEQAHEMDVAQKRLAMGWRTMGVELMRVLLPVMKGLVDRGIQTVKMLIDTARHTDIVKTSLIFLSAAAVAAGTAVALAWAPEIAIFTALGAVVWGVYLLFDDFYTFLTGGKSVIGQSLESMGIDSKGLAATMRESFEAIGKAIGLVSDGVKGTNTEFLKWFAESTPAMIKWGGTFLTSVVRIIDMAISGVKELGILLGGVFNAGAALVGGKGLGGAGDALKAAWSDVDKDNAAAEKRQALYSQLQAGFNAIGQGDLTAKRKVAPAVPDMRESDPNYKPTADEQNPGRTTGGGRVIQTTNSVTVHVNAAGATNPSAVGNAVARGVRDGLKNPDSTNRNTFDAVSDVSPVGVGG